MGLRDGGPVTLVVPPFVWLSRGGLSCIKFERVKFVFGSYDTGMSSVGGI